MGVLLVTRIKRPLYPFLSIFLTEVFKCDCLLINLLSGNFLSNFQAWRGYYQAKIIIFGVNANWIGTDYERW